MNKKIWICVILSILVLVVTPVEWGQDSHSHTRVSTPESKWSELVGSMHVMHAAMTSLQPTGDNDTDFVRLMLPHHQAAIDMAKTQCYMARTHRYVGWRRRSSPTSSQKSS
jgi:hypothetical protein